MLTILDVLTVEDSSANEEFWRQQKYVDIPRVPKPRSHLDLIPDAADCLRGKRIAVPNMYIGGRDPTAKSTVVSQDVVDLWQRARKDLEALGAIVVETDFPLVTNYEDDSVSGESNNVLGFKLGWNAKERGELVAYLWDDFLRANGDFKYSSGLGTVDGSNMFPRPDGYIPDRYMERKNFMNYPGVVEFARKRNGKSIWEIDGIAEALPALEAQRKRDLEDWMDKQGLDVVVFPANGDVGRADLETNDESARQALENGVKYSNGNRAIRHMGIPSVSVCMGTMAQSSMPVNLTFAGKHGQDTELLKYAYAFEKHTRRRIEPPVTPALASDSVASSGSTKVELPQEPTTLNLVVISAEKTDVNSVYVQGRFKTPSKAEAHLEAFVDGEPMPQANISISEGHWELRSSFIPFEPPKPLYGGVGLVVGNINIVVLIRSGNLVAGKMVTIPQD